MKDDRAERERKAREERRLKEERDQKLREERERIEHEKKQKEREQGLIREKERERLAKLQRDKEDLEKRVQAERYISTTRHRHHQYHTISRQHSNGLPFVGSGNFLTAKNKR